MAAAAPMQPSPMMGGMKMASLGDRMMKAAGWGSAMDAMKKFRPEPMIGAGVGAAAGLAGAHLTRDKEKKPGIGRYAVGALGGAGLGAAAGHFYPDLKSALANYQQGQQTQANMDKHFGGMDQRLEDSRQQIAAEMARVSG